MRVITLLFCLLYFCGATSGQPPVVLHDAEQLQHFLTAVEKIPIFDTQAHPAMPGDAEMSGLVFTTAGFGALEPYHYPVRLRPNNLEWIPALQALHGYPYADLSSLHLRELTVLQQQTRSLTSVAYFNEVLDKAGVVVSLANRVGMTSALLDRQRFKWVPSIDAYLFPLNNQVYKKRHNDYQVFFSSAEKLLNRYFALVETTRPRRFDAYLQFIRESLGRLKADGAVAVQFDVAHLRSLFFDDPSQRQARRVYERYRNATEVPEEEYRFLQDYLFRYLLREATKLGFPVHVHTGIGVGNAFRLEWANPLLLENILVDPQYRETKFVLLQGGYPFTREALLLATKPNVFLASSGLALRLYPSDLGHIVKDWLSAFPEKVLFGTGAMVMNEVIGAEAAYWLATNSGRQAVALGLREMVKDQRCDAAEALQRAHLMLHDNAARLYGLP